MNKSSLLGWLGNGGWRLGLCAAALPVAMLGGCTALPEDVSDDENLLEVAESEDLAEESEALGIAPSVSSAVAPVTQYGDLKVVGNQIQSKLTNTQVQLRGMSLFWSQWGGSFWNAAAVNSTVDNWGATVVRAAMGVESGGYLTNPAAEKARVKAVVDAAIAKGIYVIIDWHDHNATVHTQEAKAFFTEMAQTYGSKDNVIFEIYNEPDGESWSQIKTYAQEVIGAIRATGSDNLIVVGTPTWSQDVDQAANSPITGFSNIAYTLHFYAGTHKQSLRDKATYALSKGIPLFVTEFGTCDASGNGNLDLAESQTWINFLNANKLSWANWSLFDKNETASALVPGASTTGNWPDTSLTASGKWVKQKLLEASGVTPPPPPPPPPPGNFTFTVSPNINPWWIQVKVESPGHTIQSVTAKVNTSTYSLTLQSWGEWAVSPSSAVPGGTQVLFTATDETGAQGTYTSAAWPN